MRYFPLYEAKMFHQFDRRWATVAGAMSDATTASAGGAGSSCLE